MPSIRESQIPAGALLQNYAQQSGCYTDCFFGTLQRRVSLRDYIIAFFDTPVFRLERWILGLTAAKPSSLEDVERLADGSSDRIAMWRVEHRTDDEVLMAVDRGQVRTWLMVSPSVSRETETQLLFGSAVVPKDISADGKAKMGFVFHAMSGFTNSTPVCFSGPPFANSSAMHIKRTLGHIPANWVTTDPHQRDDKADAQTVSSSRFASETRWPSEVPQVGWQQVTVHNSAQSPLSGVPRLMEIPFGPALSVTE